MNSSGSFTCTLTRAAATNWDFFPANMSWKSAFGKKVSLKNLLNSSCAFLLPFPKASTKFSAPLFRFSAASLMTIKSASNPKWSYKKDKLIAILHGSAALASYTTNNYVFVIEIELQNCLFLTTPPLTSYVRITEKYGLRGADHQHQISNILILADWSNFFFGENTSL